MKTLIFIVCMGWSAWAGAQSVVKEFLSTEVPDGSRSFYLYQSTLRSFSSKNSASFNKLIKDVEKISIHLLPDSLEAGKIDGLEKTLRSQDFGDVKSLKEKIPGITLLVRKEGKSKRYVALMQEGEKSVIVELEGEVNLLHIRSLREMDMEKVMSFFGLELPNKRPENHSNE